jgi:multiple sugar transport system substrate-binding protein
LNWIPRSRAGFGIVKRAAVMVAAVALVAACGGTSAAGNGNAVATSSDQVSITIGIPLPSLDMPSPLLQQFEQSHPNIHVNTIETTWGDWPAKLQALNTAGQTPTVFMYDGGTVQGYGAEGLALNLKNFIKSSHLNQSEYIDLNYSQDSKGDIWGVPQGYQPVALAYNKTLFDQAGVSYPTDQWSWSAMINAATKLHQQTHTCGLITDHDITAGWLPFMWANGGVPFNQNVTKADFTSPLVEKGVQQWESLVQAGVICNESTIQANQNNLTTVFGKGMGAMMLMQYGQVGGVLKNFPSLNWDVTALPRGVVNEIPNIANPWVIYKHATPAQQRAGWTFLQWWLSPKTQDEYAADGLAIPALRSAGNYLPSTPAHLKQAFVTAPAQYGHTMYETSKWGDWEAVAEPIFLQIFEGQVGVKPGLQQVNTAVNGVLNGSSQG